MDLDTNTPALESLAAELRGRAGADSFYIFWFAGGRGSPPEAPPRERLLLAFRSPDAALAFAQRSVRRDGGGPPRLRRLTVAQLLAAVLREPSIAALILADDDEEAPVPGSLPAGLRIERAEILRRLDV